jgi:hypothetical protein
MNKTTTLTRFNQELLITHRHEQPTHKFTCLMLSVVQAGCARASSWCQKSETASVASIPDLLQYNIHSSAPVSTGNTFLDLPRLRETADNTERYI